MGSATAQEFQPPRGKFSAIASALEREPNQHDDAQPDYRSKGPSSGGCEVRRLVMRDPVPDVIAAKAVLGPLGHMCSLPSEATF